MVVVFVEVEIVKFGFLKLGIFRDREKKIVQIVRKIYKKLFKGSFYPKNSHAKDIFASRSF